MSLAQPVLLVNTGDGERRVVLDDYLDAGAAERADRDANAWIKSLRHLEIDGAPLRDRFRVRGDSLWWFTELYFHKQRTVVDILRTVYALQALQVRERPLSLGVAHGDRTVRHVTREFARVAKVAWHGPAVAAREHWQGTLEAGWRGTFYAASAALRSIRPTERPVVGASPVRVAAFVHSAFWRPATDDESYVGPVLRELAARVGQDQLAIVGLGPATNFRSRTWPQRFREFLGRSPASVPFAHIRSYARRRDLGETRRVWAERSTVRRALLCSRALRGACVFQGCDAWPLIRTDLVGVSHMQFPWSARMMDEAAAALDLLKPGVIVTYAEAGGQGRALVLEARRRGIPAVGLQHGFIYRHWLNYRHEPDEMQPSTANPDDHGFPRPDLTLLYDQFAARYLVDDCHFPASSVGVSGSPKLDAFVDTARAMDEAARDAVRRSVGVAPGQHLVVVATKFVQIAPAFAALVAAVRDMPDVRLVVKCHPAETGDPYEHAAAGVSNVVVAPASADLAKLITAASLVVTVNSTAAIEAMPLDVPAMVVALPNNLSPFVDAGAVAGATANAEIGPMLRAVLYDVEFRAKLANGRRAFMEEYLPVPDGRAAARAADAIVRLATRRVGG